MTARHTPSAVDTFLLGQRRLEDDATSHIQIRPSLPALVTWRSIAKAAGNRRLRSARRRHAADRTNCSRVARRSKAASRSRSKARFNAVIQPPTSRSRKLPHNWFISPL